MASERARSGRRFNKRRRKARERAVLDEVMPLLGYILLDVIEDWTARGIIEAQP